VAGVLVVSARCPSVRRFAAVVGGMVVRPVVRVVAHERLRCEYGGAGVDGHVRRRRRNAWTRRALGRDNAPMERIESARRFDVPVERGFAFITNPANWPRFWPGYVRLEEDSRWGGVGDTARLVTRLFGRERLLTMRITAFEPNRLVTYTSTQPGLPDASHERRFEPVDSGFTYRLVVEYEPRGGATGLFDRVLLPRGIRRAFESTFAALEAELDSG
jgi:uncharacterized protein YndB with AHSA1/START domain